MSDVGISLKFNINFEICDDLTSELNLHHEEIHLNSLEKVKKFNLKSFLY